MTNTNTGGLITRPRSYGGTPNESRYIELAKKYHGGRNDGFLTDAPRPNKLSSDDFVKVRYDAKAMCWIPNRPSRITYPKAKELIEQYRREYAGKWN